jgi:hypothetical protein
MAAISWLNVRGREFTQEEARSASDFGEIIALHGLGFEEAYNLFKDTALSVGQRLLFAEKIPIGMATIILLGDPMNV